MNAIDDKHNAVLTVTYQLVDRTRRFTTLNAELAYRELLLFANIMVYEVEGDKTSGLLYHVPATGLRDRQVIASYQITEEEQS